MFLHCIEALQLYSLFDYKIHKMKSIIIGSDQIMLYKHFKKNKKNKKNKKK